MRRKFRLFSTLTAMALVLVVLCVGIWAATSASITSSGGSLTVETTDDVLATVVFNFDNQHSSSNKTITFDTSNTNPASETIALPNYEFTATTKSYSFSIEVTNDFTDGSSVLYGDLTVSVTKSDFEVTIEKDLEPYTSATSFEVPAGTSEERGKTTFEVTVTYNGNFGESLSDTLKLSLNLSKKTA